MICVKCRHSKTTVVNSRSRANLALTWRRHECPQCHVVFTTEERPSAQNVLNIATSAGNEPFSISRLTVSIAAAFQHNPMYGKTVAYDIARTIELKLLSPQTQQCTPATIASIAATTLENFESQAATIYRAQHQMS